MKKKTWWLIGLSVVVALLITFIIILRIKIGDIPKESDLKKISHPVASEIYSQDSVLLGRFFVENRTNVEYEEIPEIVLNALVATEDARFFEHEGVDFRSLVRVFFKTLLMQDRSAGGGSTLSQQLAKNLFPRAIDGKLDIAAVKIKEMIVASRLEALYTKQELITLYLNTVSFGEDVYGLGTASMRYFNKPPMRLAPEEAAVLVGMLKATTSYNPRLHPQKATARRNTVLDQMAKYGYLNEETKDTLARLPLKLNYSRHTNEIGSAPYFKALVKPMIDSILDQLPGSKAYNLQTDGLRITLPIDSRLQYAAEKATQDHMLELQKQFMAHWSSKKPWDRYPRILDVSIERSQEFQELQAEGLNKEQIMRKLAEKAPSKTYTSEGVKDTLISPLDIIKNELMLLHAGMVALDPQTGHIKAWVGGIDFNYFQYDHVLAKRQVGSTFKPIVYAAALEGGLDPCTYYSNEQIVYEEYDNWSPANANNHHEGHYSLKGALTNSVNTVSAQVIIETGVSQVVDLAKRLGIKESLPEVPSLALGTAEIPLLQMVNAYATLANRGQKTEPVYLLKIENNEGDVLWAHQRSKEQGPALDRKTTRVITDFMESVVNQGTAVPLRSRYGLHMAIAGKTGTTQSYADGWFIGFTPNVVAGVWVGADNPGIHFRSPRYGQGAAMALPIWAGFMQSALKDTTFSQWKSARFDPLGDDLIAQLDCPLYKSEEDLTLFDQLFGVKDRDKKEKKPLGKRILDFFKKKKD